MQNNYTSLRRQDWKGLAPDHGLFTDVETRNGDSVHIGLNSGKISVGSSNVFIGVQAGFMNYLGSENVFIGHAAGALNQMSDTNVFIGNYAGYSNINGNNNLCIGRSAGEANADGCFNVFLGMFSGANNVNGSTNLCIGFQCGQSNTSGNFNVFLGNQSGLNNRSGDFNVFAGTEAGRFNTSSYNVFLGYQSGYFNVSGQSNIFIGTQAGNNNFNGNNNVFIGHEAGYSNIGGFCNVVIGTSSAYNNVGGSENVIVGSYTGLSNIGSRRNVILGTASGRNISGTGNSVMGYNCANHLVNGDGNVLLGFSADVVYPQCCNAVVIGPNACADYSVAIGNAITVSRYRNVVLGNDIATDSDNTVCLGNGITFESVYNFRDPLISSYTVLALKDGQLKFSSNFTISYNSNIFESFAATRYTYTNDASNNSSLVMNEKLSPPSYLLHQRDAIYTRGSIAIYDGSETQDLVGNQLPVIYTPGDIEGGSSLTGGNYSVIQQNIKLYVDNGIFNSSNLNIWLSDPINTVYESFTFETPQKVNLVNNVTTRSKIFTHNVDVFKRITPPSMSNVSNGHVAASNLTVMVSSSSLISLSSLTSNAISIPPTGLEPHFYAPGFQPMSCNVDYEVYRPLRAGSLVTDIYHTDQTVGNFGWPWTLFYQPNPFYLGPDSFTFRLTNPINGYNIPSPIYEMSIELLPTFITAPQMPFLTTAAAVTLDSRFITGVASADSPLQIGRIPPGSFLVDEVVGITYSAQEIALYQNMARSEIYTIGYLPTLLTNLTSNLKSWVSLNETSNVLVMPAIRLIKTAAMNASANTNLNTTLRQNMNTLISLTSSVTSVGMLNAIWWQAVTSNLTPLHNDAIGHFSTPAWYLANINTCMTNSNVVNIYFANQNADLSLGVSKTLLSCSNYSISNHFESIANIESCAPLIDPALYPLIPQGLSAAIAPCSNVLADIWSHYRVAPISLTVESLTTARLSLSNLDTSPDRQDLSVTLIYSSNSNSSIRNSSYAGITNSNTSNTTLLIPYGDESSRPTISSSNWTMARQPLYGTASNTGTGSISIASSYEWLDYYADAEIEPLLLVWNAQGTAWAEEEVVTVKKRDLKQTSLLFISSNVNNFISSISSNTRQSDLREVNAVVTQPGSNVWINTVWPEGLPQEMSELIELITAPTLYYYVIQTNDVLSNVLDVSSSSNYVTDAALVLDTFTIVVTSNAIIYTSNFDTSHQLKEYPPVRPQQLISSNVTSNSPIREAIGGIYTCIDYLSNISVFTTKTITSNQYFLQTETTNVLQTTSNFIFYNSNTHDTLARSNVVLTTQYSYDAPRTSNTMYLRSTSNCSNIVEIMQQGDFKPLTHHQLYTFLSNVPPSNVNYVVTMNTMNSGSPDINFQFFNANTCQYIQSFTQSDINTENIYLNTSATNTNTTMSASHTFTFAVNSLDSLNPLNPLKTQRLTCYATSLPCSSTSNVDITLLMDENMNLYTGLSDAFELVGINLDGWQVNVEGMMQPECYFTTEGAITLQIQPATLYNRGQVHIDSNICWGNAISGSSFVRWTARMLPLHILSTGLNLNCGVSHPTQLNSNVLRTLLPEVPSTGVLYSTQRLTSVSILSNMQPLNYNAGGQGTFTQADVDAGLVTIQNGSSLSSCISITLDITALTISFSSNVNVVINPYWMNDYHLNSKTNVGSHLIHRVEGLNTSNNVTPDAALLSLSTSLWIGQSQVSSSDIYLIETVQPQRGYWSSSTNTSSSIHIWSLADWLSGSLHYVSLDSNLGNDSCAVRLSYASSGNSSSVSPFDIPVTIQNYRIQTPNQTYASNLNPIVLNNWLSDGLLEDGYALQTSMSSLLSATNSIVPPLSLCGVRNWSQELTPKWISSPGQLQRPLSNAFIMPLVEQADSCSLAPLLQFPLDSRESAELIYCITSNVTHGLIYRVDNSTVSHALIGVRSFTSTQLASNAILYQHSGDLSQSDTFTYRLASSPFDLQTSRDEVTVTIPIQPLPTITSNADRYHYTTSSNVAGLTFDLFGDISSELQNPMNNAVTTCYHVLTSNQMTLPPLFTLNSSGSCSYTCSSNIFQMSEFSTGFTFVANSSPTRLNPLVFNELYSGLFQNHYKVFINTIVNHNSEPQTDKNIKMLSFDFHNGGSNTDLGNHVVSITVDVNPFQDLFYADALANQFLVEGVAKHDFECHIRFGNASFIPPARYLDVLNGVYMSYSDLVVNATAVVTLNRTQIVVNIPPFESFTIPLDVPIPFCEFTTVLFNNTSTGVNVQLKFLNGNTIYPFSQIPQLDLSAVTTIELISDVNHPKNSYSYLSSYGMLHSLRDVRTDLGIPIAYDMLFDVNQIRYKSFTISYSTYSLDSRNMDLTYNNIALGQGIRAKGINNICIGTNFVTSGTGSIILGQNIGVRTFQTANGGSASSNGTYNDIYESIVIGNDCFYNAEIANTICIGTKNFNDLEAILKVTSGNVQQAADANLALLNRFIANQPILIGNDIKAADGLIHYPINIGNSYFKSLDNNLFLGLQIGGENKVAVGYSLSNSINLNLNDPPETQMFVNGLIETQGITNFTGCIVMQQPVSRQTPLLSPGQVVSIISLSTSNQLVPSSVAHDSAIMGVIKNTPSTNMLDSSMMNYTVAISGLATVLLAGPASVSIGDLLTSSSNAGYAMLQTSNAGIISSFTLGKVIAPCSITDSSGQCSIRLL